jgi:hypothetical protein
VQVCANLIGIGAIDGGGLIPEKIILFVVAEEVALAGRSHVSHD